MYRVDGVSGLNVLTGIKSKSFCQQLRSRQAINPVPAGYQLSVCKHAVLPALRAKRSGETIKCTLPCKLFFEKFWDSPTSSKFGILPEMTTLLAHFGGKVIVFDTQQGRGCAVSVRLSSCN
jgi:hypothetical protein